MIESLKLLLAADETIKDNLLAGLSINTKLSETRLLKSPAITTALSPFIGYHKASELAKEMKATSCNIFEANNKLGLIDEARLKTILGPENLMKMGYSIKDQQL
jgi:aspartate ammonia-lyase